MNNGNAERILLVLYCTLYLICLAIEHVTWVFAGGKREREMLVAGTYVYQNNVQVD